MEDSKLERRITELKVQYTRYRYFRAKSELNKLRALEEEDFETAAKERDNLVVLAEKIHEVSIKRNELLNRKKQ
jgi:protein-arginine kinase activator protein McsA